ncbi:hypothetical protein ABTK02_22560, partial [Acinetobacter baumannii]
IEEGRTKVPLTAVPQIKIPPAAPSQVDKKIEGSQPVSIDASEFKGKRILVTGGTKGIGKAIVERFQKGGGTVITTSRSM